MIVRDLQYENHYERLVVDQFGFGTDLGRISEKKLVPETRSTTRSCSQIAEITSSQLNI